ncbi:MAG: Hsp70 family protein, partial [Anaerolineaceae bacterium]|nr:Hsp70 family protein [Anaerolineaceae bacterium]
NKADIERMVKVAKENESADQRRKAVVEARNGTETAVYQVEKALKENGEKTPAALKAEAETAIKEAQQAAAGDDLERIQKANEQLQNLYGQVLSAGSSNAGGSNTPPAQEQGPATNPEGDVVEGEFKTA